MYIYIHTYMELNIYIYIIYIYNILYIYSIYTYNTCSNKMQIVCYIKNNIVLTQVTGNGIKYLIQSLNECIMWLFNFYHKASSKKNIYYFQQYYFCCLSRFFCNKNTHMNIGN